jgi:hypothetical protein
MLTLGQKRDGRVTTIEPKFRRKAGASHQACHCFLAQLFIKKWQKNLL